jgi:hypothetical protein
MKTRYSAEILIVASLIAAATVLNAQSLGDVARASREKRMKVMQQKSVRIWTNDNIPKAPPSSGATAAGGMSAEPMLPQAQAQSVPPSEAGAPAAAPVDDKKNDRDYWQSQFKSARQKIVADQEQQRLAEDELSLLQIQQARELSPDRQTELDAQVKAKTAEVEDKRAQTAKSKKQLEDLEKDLKESGAPADWSKPE